MSSLSFKLTAKTAPVRLQLRHSFAPQFFIGAALQTRQAKTIEANCPNVSEQDKEYHRSCVVGAIIQAVAGLDSSVSEVFMHGPRHHLGSGGDDKQAERLLSAVAHLADRDSVLERFNTALRLLGQPIFKPGERLFQEASLAVKLRNEIVHFKSHWCDSGSFQGEDKWAEKKNRLMAALESKSFTPPNFVSGSSDFFPHKCLSSECAKWVIESCLKLHSGFFERLSVPNPFESYAELMRV